VHPFDFPEVNMDNDDCWDGEIFRRKNQLPPGYRVSIFGGSGALESAIRVPGSRHSYSLPPSSKKEQLHWSGGETGILCPCCNNPLTSVFAFDLNDEKVANVLAWEKPSLFFMACCCCTLARTGYVVYHDEIGLPTRVAPLDDQPTTIMGTPDLPVPERPISLTPLEPIDFPLDEGSLERLDNRWPPIVNLHQIGGVPPTGGPVEMTCPDCETQLHFLGVIDHDDKNFPLTEKGNPAALQIGDANHLNLSSCPRCSAILYQMVA